MPLYTFSCVACGSRTDEYRAVEHRNEAPTCRCGGSTERIISAPAMVMPDIKPYRSTIDGSMISSRSQHRAHLKQHNCIEIGNEKLPDPKPKEAPPGTKQAVIEAFHKARR